METISQPPASLTDEATGTGMRRRGGCRPVGGLMIAAIVLGFIFAWPIGLGLLLWAIWHRDITAWWQRNADKFRTARREERSHFQGFMAKRPSNAALAAYLDREQDRLREEQKKLDELVREFEAFKAAEREAIDKQDFEAFLKAQANRNDVPGEGRRDQPATGTGAATS